MDNAEVEESQTEDKTLAAVSTPEAATFDARKRVTAHYHLFYS